ncbi:DNA polymerase I [Orrella daihaiensis]|uniref:DNA polymerase I n=1 Tax=Orrella daihaiensis TaxID=2782176 RepID=A0ABY4AN33_9BURK|nr:DNA polymerase I [Orrella daihaiensis]UOD49459.1 DNA polymerase I [Orrella daihaiensis]
MKKNLLLVDGSSYLYRAYHAMPDLRNAQGEPTGALYGVINMMRKLIQDYQPDYAACVFDVKGKTFREDMYDQYKANRAAMPEDLATQIEPIHQAVAALGWPVVGITGVEADDVIGTLARVAHEHGVKTIISTGDKDLAQLVTPDCILVNTMNGETLDPEGVKAKFGVSPDRIVDYLMLVGDAVDNVPGVNKVGPKTAVKWLDAYGDIDNLIAKADEVSGAVGNNLRAALDQFALTRDLLTVRTDCDLPSELLSIESLTPKPADKDKLIQIYERYGFRTWLRELTGQSDQIPRGDSRVVRHEDGATSQDTIASQQIETNYETVTTLEQAKHWLASVQQADLVAFDTETTSLDGMQARLVGFSLSIEAGKACYVPLAHRGPQSVDQLSKDEILALFKPWFESNEPTKLLHHAKYDMHVLANEGIALSGVAHDTMLQAYVLESHRSVALDQLSERWLGLKGLSYQDICGKGAQQIGFDEVSIEQASQYACEDADYTRRLHELLYPQIQASDDLSRIYELELQVSGVLWQIERTGVRVDVSVLQKQSQSLGEQLINLEKRAYELAGQPFNLNSPKQLGEILFGQMQLPVVRKTASGTPSTDEEVLSKLALDYPLPKLLLQYRGLAKLKSTYTDKLPKMVNAKTGRVHTNYAQAAVITGRLSSSDPNLQNIPIRTPEGRQVRQAFIPTYGQGKLVSADYSQIELRVMAHVSGDQGMREAFANAEDIHRATAAEVFGVALNEVTADQRRTAKTINFGLIYGMGAHGLASNLGITREAAQSYIDRYFTRYPGVAQYMADTKAKAHEQGYVQTVFGRRLWLPDINAGGARRAGAERAAINAPMQGTAADLIKMAMVKVQHWIQTEHLQSRVIMQVHDELVLDVTADELVMVCEQLPRLMCDVAQLTVPLVAEVGQGDNWDQAH